MLLKPLEQWICDRCHEVINSSKEGWVEWLSEPTNYQFSDFKIVHQSPYSPRKPESDCFHYTSHPNRTDQKLELLLENRMEQLFSWLDKGKVFEPDYPGPQVGNMRDFVELARRITLPYYEEARLYFADAIEDGFIDEVDEITLYLQKNLQEVIRRYGKQL